MFEEDEINQIYHCSAFELLTELPDQSIDLFYSDILFRTGRKFKTGFYDLPFDEQVIKDFYCPIFTLMRQNLKLHGLVYIHLDYRISHWIRSLLDDIFGFEHFQNEIIWNYNSGPRKKAGFGKRHDTIFRYSKGPKPYLNKDSDLIYEPYSETAQRGYAKEKYYNPKGKILSDVWTIPMLGQNDKTERTGYATQKPLKLLKLIVDSSCPPHGIVCDVFAGSGTTLVAAKLLNRRFTGCDINEVTIDITNKRLQKC